MLRHRQFRELFKKSESGPWWAYIPNPRGGRALRETTGLRDDRAAHAWYLERVRSPAPRGGELEAASKKERSLRKALSDRIDWLKAARSVDDPTRKKKALETISFYEEKSKPLVKLLGGDTLLSAIGHEEIRRYIVARSATAAGTTIAKELTTLSGAWKLARKDGVHCAVFEDIVPVDFETKGVRKERWLTMKEAEALVFGGELPPKRAAVCAFIFACGATYPSEVLPVRPSHVTVRVVKRRRIYEVHVPGTKRDARDRHLRVPPHGVKFIEYALKHLGDTGFELWTNIRQDLLDAAARLSRCKKCRRARGAPAGAGRLSAIDLGHADTVREIQRLRASGMTFKSIADELTARAVATPLGGRWFAASVRKLAMLDLSAPRPLSRRAAKARGVPWSPPANDCAACKAMPPFLPFCPTDMRRTFSQWLARSGVPHELMYPMMGHTSDKMLRERYGKRAATANADLVEQALANAPKNALG